MQNELIAKEREIVTSTEQLDEANEEFQRKLKEKSKEVRDAKDELVRVQ